MCDYVKPIVAEMMVSIRRRVRSLTQSLSDLGLQETIIVNYIPKEVYVADHDFFFFLACSQNVTQHTKDFNNIYNVDFRENNAICRPHQSP